MGLASFNTMYKELSERKEQIRAQTEDRRKLQVKKVQAKKDNSKNEEEL